MGIKEPQVTRAHLISFRRSGPGRHVRTLNGMRENTSGSAGQRLARTLRKANRMSAAVEKRSTLTGAHALIRNPARPGLRSKRIVLGSVTGTQAMGRAFGNGWWPLQRSR